MRLTSVKMSFCINLLRMFIYVHFQFQFRIYIYIVYIANVWINDKQKCIFLAYSNKILENINTTRTPKAT